MTTEMTSRERLTRVLRGEPTDRVPIWMLFPYKTHPAYADVYNEPSYARVVEHVRKHTDFFHRIGMKASADSGLICEVETADLGNGEWRKTLRTPKGELISYLRRDSNGALRKKEFFKTIEDLDKFLSIPYEMPEPDLGHFASEREAIGDRGLMMIDLSDPLSALYHYSDLEEYSIWTQTERDAITKFLDVMFERIYAYLRVLLESGVGPTFFLVGSEFAEPPMTHPEAFDYLILKYDSKLIDLIHQYGCYAIVHHHGTIDPLLEKIASMKPDALHTIEAPPIGDCELADAKRRIGDRVCLIGNIQYGDLNICSEDEIEEMVRRAIEDAKDGGRYILSPTAGPYETAITKRTSDNYIRFIEAGLKHGRYK
ncbi:MAG: uroporphyrinogen decarboxylase family protein [bacterium]